MSNRRVSKAGGKKGKKGKEDPDKAQREEEMRQLEILNQLEREAETRQQAENETRDDLEIKEIKRMKKAAQLALMAEKDNTISTLTQQINDMTRTFAAERAELEDELRRMLQMKDSVLNELSQCRGDYEKAVQDANLERATLTRRIEDLEHSLDASTGDCGRLTASRDELENKIKLLLERHATETSLLRNKAETTERDLTARVHHLERELDRSVALSKTLQEVIDTREADDRKNVVLMGLLNNQLDENKKRSTELIEDERARNRQLLQDLADTELKLKHTTEENELHRQEKGEIQKQAELALEDYKTKLDAVKFDVKFLHSELNIYKSKLTKQSSDLATREKEVVESTTKMSTELGSANDRISELEALVRQRDRDHFDKVTLLNAQITNNRTTITQLQAKIEKDKMNHNQEVEALQEELRTRRSKLESVQNDMDRHKVGSTENENRLHNDIAVLKTTVFQLQSNLVEKERELDNIVAVKDDELGKLKRKLDEHFIPYRKELSSNEAASATTLESILNDKITKLGRDMEVRQKVSAETEARLKAQLANQNHIIESLQCEINSVRDDSSEKISVLSRENDRLKRTLETGNMRNTS
eukprot:PhM_4_TR597/c0_g1_i1/m.29953